MDIFFGKIDAEWVDPKTEMPPDGWYGMIIWRGVPEMRSAKWNGKDWQSADVEPFLYYKSEVVAWMRLSGRSDVCTCPIFMPGSSDINNRIMCSELHHAEPYGQPTWKFCPWCGGSVWQSVTGVTPTKEES